MKIPKPVLSRTTATSASPTLEPSVLTSSALAQKLRALTLPHMAEHAASAAAEAARSGHGHLAYLEALITAEIAALHDRSITRRLAAARFPVPKTMAGWNWSWPRKINRMQFEHLLKLGFLENHTNVLLLGPTGVGKTHLACALGHAACLQRHHVLYASTIDVVNRLSAAHAASQLASEIKRYTAPRLLILDELGYLPLDKRGSELLFQIISKRYEAGSTIITTNIAFKAWPTIFAGDATMTSALLDRLLHHAETLVIEGDSYRSAKTK